MAYLVDAILIWLVGVGAQMGLDSLVGPRWPELLTMLSITIEWGVLNFFLIAKDGIAGQSPGKSLLGVQVVDVTSREPIGGLQSVKRNLPLLMPILGALLVLLTMMKGQRLGDEWANTMVIRKKHRTRVPYALSGGYCRSCRYDLTGNVSGRCPECGTSIPADWLD